MKLTHHFPIEQEKIVKSLVLPFPDQIMTNGYLQSLKYQNDNEMATENKIVIVEDVNGIISEIDTKFNKITRPK